MSFKLGQRLYSERNDCYVFLVQNVGHKKWHCCVTTRSSNREPFCQTFYEHDLENLIKLYDDETVFQAKERINNSAPRLSDPETLRDITYNYMPRWGVSVAVNENGDVVCFSTDKANLELIKADGLPAMWASKVPADQKIIACGFNYENGNAIHNSPIYENPDDHRDSELVKDFIKMSDELIRKSSPHIIDKIYVFDDEGRYFLSLLIAEQFQNLSLHEGVGSSRMIRLNKRMRQELIEALNSDSWSKVSE